MTTINFDKIFELLSEKSFQDPRTGNLFFPAYIYTYPPKDEYEVRKNIEQAVKNLKRPSHYLDTMLINIYHELISFLKSETFMKKSLFDLLLEKEKEDPEDALSWVQDEINDGDFYDQFEAKVEEHFRDAGDKRVYLILYGFGSVFPYLRTSELIKRTERLIKDFKVIIFFPGTYEDSNYNLFEMMNDENMYRANHLNNLLSQ